MIRVDLCDNVVHMTKRSAAKLSEFELLLALAMVRLGDEAYGAALTREIEERTGREVSLGATYKTLDRLDGKGFLTSRIGPPLATRGGRRRKHYRLTDPGRQALKQTLADLDAMRHGLDRALGQPSRP